MYGKVTDKVTVSDGAILAICGQDRLTRPARRLLKGEGALSGTGIRNTLRNVRQQTAATLHDERAERTTPTTTLRRAESCVFATYTTRDGRSGPRRCRIGIWNTHAWSRLTDVPPRKPSENGAARRCESLNGILAHWHSQDQKGSQNLERAIRTRAALARGVLERAARAWDASSNRCRIGVHLAEPEELRLSRVLAPGAPLVWSLRRTVARKRPKWTLERTVLHHGWPRGNAWGMRSWGRSEAHIEMERLANDTSKVSDETRT